MSDDALMSWADLEARWNPHQMATLIGWRVIRRAYCECDDCAKPAAVDRWLVCTTGETKSNQVRSICEPCLKKRLDRHLKEQGHLDSIVEEHPHPGMEALNQAVAAVLST